MLLGLIIFTIESKCWIPVELRNIIAQIVKYIFQALKFKQNFMKFQWNFSKNSNSQKNYKNLTNFMKNLPVLINFYSNKNFFCSLRTNWNQTLNCEAKFFSFLFLIRREILLISSIDLSHFHLFFSFYEQFNYSSHLLLLIMPK